MSCPACSVDPELKETINKFRHKRDFEHRALIMKIDAESHTVILEKKIDNIKDVDELRDSIPNTQPRYVLLQWVVNHPDGRKSLPLVFIFVTPRDCQPHLQMMYASSQSYMVKECSLAKVFQIRDIDELDDDWILENLIH